ncbi:MAG: hypothetical protein CMJ64_00235 [Planctomycetaceae bacterium]|nr:hypothetical protein [Planctomycetaceae bacterium]
MRIDSSFVVGRTRIALGAGDDLAEIVNSLFVGSVRINGGSGTDTFTDGLGNLFAGGLFLPSVEIII